MKKFIAYAFAMAACVGMTATTALAEPTTFAARARLQGTTNDDGLGMSGVLELPSLSVDPGQVMALAGLSHVGDSHEVLVNLGGVTLNGEADGVVDVRGQLDLTDNVFGWANLRWTGFEDPDDSVLYGFAMADFRLPGKLSVLAVGLESENVVNVNSDLGEDFSYGPNLLLVPSEHVRFELAYQKHSNVDNQAWLRVVGNL